jgi:hypothetical protein
MGSLNKIPILPLIRKDIALEIIPFLSFPAADKYLPNLISWPYLFWIYPPENANPFCSITDTQN